MALKLNEGNTDEIQTINRVIAGQEIIVPTTSIYSGILRLSDLRTVAPNSNYPLFIVAPREKRPLVFEQIRRPTFSNPYLKLKEAIRFLSYDKVRDLDERFADRSYGLTTEMVLRAGVGQLGEMGEKEG